ncbi:MULTISPECIES: hypothetical protein [unclassified Corynebacterium]|uniref:hypothetical protein n=1 Tax=unclassified Corynebacterium TaxID=2624378 RepID=UPI0029CA9785|nr:MULTISPECIES: hypothetical protein [unclassified Corynebacterium]WPF66060.1 hypothetical protein OLX12_11000 [Corynebacterium sp. 22KM0430]WPF68552.1 hypothetical protein OLW90_10995 [Corynebacterium sp. 21KM1197]
MSKSYFREGETPRVAAARARATITVRHRLGKFLPRWYYEIAGRPVPPEVIEAEEKGIPVEEIDAVPPQPKLIDWI